MEETREALWPTRNYLRVPADRNVGHLASSRQSGVIAFAAFSHDRDIFKADLASPGGPAPARPLIASSRLDSAPSFSNDGAKIAFVSERSGSSEIWISDSRGGTPHQLTITPETQVGSPVRSPDNTQIAYVVSINGQSKICTARVNTGASRVLTPDGPHELAPSWSSDGRWIYVSRQLGSDWIIAKRDSADGSLLRLTSGRGFGAVESPDPNVVLYSRAEEDAVQLWSVSAHGQQDDSRVSDFPGQPVSWTLRAGGIFTCYHTSHDDEHFRISFRTLTDTHEEVVLQTTSRPGLRFDISPDGRFIVFDRVTHSESDIIGLRSPQRTL